MFKQDDPNEREKSWGFFLYFVLEKQVQARSTDCFSYRKLESPQNTHIKYYSGAIYYCKQPRIIEIIVLLTLRDKRE